MSKEICEECKITFSTSGNFRRHIKLVHKTNKIPQTNRSSICGICFANFGNLKELEKHLSDSHEIILKHEKLTFYSEDEFTSWKSATEQNSVSSLVMKGVRRGDSTFTKYYMCHRSGHQQRVLRQEDRKKRQKRSGSVKIGSTCPARMKVVFQTINEAQEIQVEYQSVHVGHDLEVKKLRLTRDERQKLASLLVMGISQDSIVSKIHEEYSPLRRLGITRKQDLHNIRRDFHIDQELQKDDSGLIDNVTEKNVYDKNIPPCDVVPQNRDVLSTDTLEVPCIMYESNPYLLEQSRSDVITTQCDFRASNPSNVRFSVDNTKISYEVDIGLDAKQQEIRNVSSDKIEIQSEWRMLSQRVEKAESAEELKIIREQIKIMNDILDRCHT